MLEAVDFLPGQLIILGRNSVPFLVFLKFISVKKDFKILNQMFSTIDVQDLAGEKIAVENKLKGL